MYTNVRLWIDVDLSKYSIIKYTTWHMFCYHFEMKFTRFVVNCTLIQSKLLFKLGQIKRSENNISVQYESMWLWLFATGDGGSK